MGIYPSRYNIPINLLHNDLKNRELWNNILSQFLSIMYMYRCLCPSGHCSRFTGGTQGKSVWASNAQVTYYKKTPRFSAFRTASDKSWGGGLRTRVTRGGHSHRRCTYGCTGGTTRSPGHEGFFFLSDMGSLRFFKASRDPLEGRVIA